MGRVAELSKAETRKDTVQVLVESGATHAGRIAGILTDAVRGVTREVGEFATDVFEMRAAARRAEADAAQAEVVTVSVDAEAEVVEPDRLAP